MLYISSEQLPSRPASEWEGRAADYNLLSQMVLRLPSFSIQQVKLVL